MFSNGGTRLRRIPLGWAESAAATSRGRDVGAKMETLIEASPIWEYTKFRQGGNSRKSRNNGQVKGEKSHGQSQFQIGNPIPYSVQGEGTKAGWRKEQNRKIME